MSPASWVSDGREPWVFTVNRPDELPGLHEALMVGSLPAEERVLHLLYAPLWAGDDAPFGLGAEPGSHSIALTDRHLVITKDRHVTGVELVVRTIPIERILELHAGSDLLLAWFAVQYAGEDGVRLLSVLHEATGRHHFHALVRTCRRLLATTKPEPATRSPVTPPWSETRRDVPRQLEEAVSRLLLQGERPRLVARSREEWGPPSARSRKRGCLHEESVTLESANGLLLARRGHPTRPGMLSFAVDVACRPPAVSGGAPSNEVAARWTS